ncbi:MAG TPA: hypothetical protein PKD26_05015 [Pyrinomonadaceae bacterium]|nr:hypothetical protein [Pyrinomonadaceae bacterium]
MKGFLPLFVAILLAVSVPGQERPIAQAEYVRMLYGIKGTASIVEIVETIRKRGISFPVTDGIRSLTRTRSSNNQELRRALEEAERRRQDPEGARLPAESESAALLDRTRRNTLAVIEDMPDFVVKQLISRSEAYAGTGNWRPYDNLIIAVSYHSEKGEQYRVLSKNGAPVNFELSNSYSGLDGATSGGEFVEDLKKIFAAESKTRFEAESTDVLRGRNTIIYGYEIELANNKHGGVGLKGPVYSSSPAGEKGRIWIDRADARVLRIEYQLTDIIPTFPVKGVTKYIDYDMVDIAGEKHLLPVLSDFRGKVENSGRLFEQRNVIRFRSYQRYGTEVTVVEEDSEPAPVDKPLL